MRPPDEIRGIARTVIEATGPALQPVAALRRFVVKSRVDVVMAPIVDLGKAVTSAGGATGADGAEGGSPRRSSVNGSSRRQAAT